MAAEMVTFGVTIGAIQTVLRKFEVIGTLQSEFSQFCDVLRSTKIVLENVERTIGKSGSANYFGAIKQIHAAIKQGEEAIDDCAKTKNAVVNLFSDHYLSNVRAASKKLQLALSTAAFSGVAGIQQVNENVDKLDKMVSAHHSQVMETMKTHSSKLDQLHLLMQAHLIKDKEEFADMLKEAADKAEQFYRSNKPLIDKNMYDWVIGMSKEPNIDDQLICPISKDVMEDPVLLIATGSSYDRKSLCQSLLAYPNLDPASGVEFGEPLKYVDNVVVRSILIDKGRYEKYDDSEFLRQYPIAFSRKMMQLGFVEHTPTDADRIDTSARDDGSGDAEEVINTMMEAEESKQKKRHFAATFTENRPLVVSMVIIVALVALFVALRVSGRDKNSQSEQSSSTQEDSTTSNPSSIPSGSSDPAELARLINTWTLSGRTLQYPAFEAPTPEEEALAWLAEQDPIQLNPVTDAPRILQRYSLLTLWFSLSPVLENSESWLDTEDECAWEGVKSCTMTSSASSEIRELALNHMSLSGTIPADIGLLTALTVLSLASNDLTGVIPPELSNASALEDLQMAFNGLTGEIPSSFSQFPQLTKLDVAYNSLGGTIPLWLSQLADLSFLDFSFNEMRGEIPGAPLSELTSLSYLALNGNTLTGSIPTVLARLSQLTWVALSGNSALEGTIPTELSNWSNLFEGFFYGTNLNGTMPLCTSGSDSSRGRLVADCLSVDCPCCTHCCPETTAGIPVYEYC